MILASLGIVIGVVAAWYAEWGASIGLVALVLALAAVTYRGVSSESNVSAARGHVFVYPKKMNTGGLEIWFESTASQRQSKRRGMRCWSPLGGPS